MRQRIKTKWFGWSHQVTCVTVSDSEPRNTRSIDDSHTLYTAFLLQGQYIWDLETSSCIIGKHALLLWVSVSSSIKWRLYTNYLIHRVEVRGEGVDCYYMVRNGLGKYWVFKSCPPLREFLLWHVKNHTILSSTLCTGLELLTAPRNFRIRDTCLIQNLWNWLT